MPTPIILGNLEQQPKMLHQHLRIRPRAKLSELVFLDHGEVSLELYPQNQVEIENLHADCY